ncbi:hypothetical protein ACIGFK_25390 [Streptomyces sp. NPDC085524]|uniref:hypothetical protein n=1 Tax=unclassified Streptomyces TaxID=2593676 RepID=UPI0035DEE941
MEETDGGQLLASKWDIVPRMIGGLLRVVFGSLPEPVQVIVLGIIGSAALWMAITWLRERFTRAT